jgi:hypothetical protein
MYFGKTCLPSVRFSTILIFVLPALKRVWDATNISSLFAISSGGRLTSFPVVKGVNEQQVKLRNDNGAVRLAQHTNPFAA